MIEIVKVANREEGNVKAHDILATHVDGKTLVALSGGRSPDYNLMLVKNGDIKPGAFCIVDERFGEPYHADSNELLIKNAGVESFANLNQIEFAKILSGKELAQTALDYEEEFALLLGKYPKRIGIMGIGADLHTAGIFPDGDAVRSERWIVSETFDLKYPRRVTMSLKALSEFQIFLILVFDVTKKPALILLTRGKEKNEKGFPGIFYRNTSAKCYLITSVDI